MITNFVVKRDTTDLRGFGVKKFDKEERKECPSEAFGFSAGWLSDFSQKIESLDFFGFSLGGQAFFIKKKTNK